VVCVGAGSAGMGVTRVIALGMQKHGLSEEQARENIWVLDREGLVTLEREGLTDTVKRYARPSVGTFKEGMTLIEVVKQAKPTTLIGLAGAGKLFTQEVLAAMADCNERPLIFPMSNPTSKMECTAQECFEATKGTAVFASGSPQQDVTIDGKTYNVSQANNMYIFPGLAFGAHLAKTGVVSDAMLTAAAEALPLLLTEQQLKEGRVYPDLNNIRDISACVACAVINTAVKEGCCSDPGTLKAAKLGEEALLHRVNLKMWLPEYKSILNRKGIA